ncbi:MAG: hypothetical protein AAF573_05790 [Bacteroidota bacterium]
MCSTFQHLSSNYFLLLPLIFSCLLFSCSDKDENELSSTLQAHVANNAELTLHEELVACAAGGQDDFLEDENFPVSMFFYPELEATNFAYYETENSSDDPEDFSLFVKKDMDHEPLFNGFLRRFLLPPPTKDVWARVSFHANDTLWVCKPVRLKYFENPTLYAPDFCAVNLTTPTEPTFTWQDEVPNENIIYFQVISDADNNALSGTYTNDLIFQYYQLDNVVFNVTRPGQATPLLPSENYNFTLMGVSDDNWVNLIADKSFVTQ